ncbi:MAG TPA: Stp1/IreP family PP2C-type Ser/Thr phosphatase [Bacillota bacterium]|nr:Stp1/IreP family PP2C-type Ser/Thr phosphatase [Bacillota bacterium]
MKAIFLTDRGKVRDYNEDSGGYFYNDFDQLLAIIADGMGGHQAGDVASEMAVDIVKRKWQQVNKIVSPETAELWIKAILDEINHQIYEHASKKEEYHGMGTTAVIAICTNDFITIGHIGDSRCYVNNANGFQQLTEDHSLVNELVKSGQISTEDAEHHPRKNIVLKALGTEETVRADIKSLSWEKGNQLLLASDGLTDKISNEELAEFLNEDEELENIGTQMIQMANERGGEDNISLIVIKHTQKEVGDASC